MSDNVPDVSEFNKTEGNTNEPQLIVFDLPFGYFRVGEEVEKLRPTQDIFKRDDLVIIERYYFNPHQIKPEDFAIGAMHGDEWIEIFYPESGQSDPKLPHISIYDDPSAVIEIFNEAWQKAGLNRHIKITELKTVFDFLPEESADEEMKAEV